MFYTLIKHGFLSYQSPRMVLLSILDKKKFAFGPMVAHQAGAYPCFCSMKRLRVFLLPLGWDASPSQGYPSIPIYTPRWREAP